MMEDGALSPSSLLQLLSEDQNSESFVRAALRLLESNCRERALLALADWELITIPAAEWGRASRHLFTAIAELQRPSWGKWNGLLVALAKARINLLTDGIVEVRRCLEGMLQLTKAINTLDQPVDPAITSELQPLIQIVAARRRLPERPRLGQVLELAITLRNRAVHDLPDDPEWWAQAAQGLRPLVRLLCRLEIDESSAASFPVPWFLDEEDLLWSFNGVEADFTPVYVSRTGRTRHVARQSRDVLLAFQRLLGQTSARDRDFRELMTRAAPEEVKGVLFGDFLLGRPIGEGGCAIVHVGQQLSTGRKVALKVLRSELGQEQRQRFQQEAAFLARFDHPNIVQVIGCGEETWTPPHHVPLAGEAWYDQFSSSGLIKSYLALEWVDGVTLEAVFERGIEARPGVHILTEWFAQAAEALAAVHELGLIHRDVKPGNLMVTRDGRIKLMDFGIARSNSEMRTLHTATGFQLGTPAYMSPEQLRPGDSVTASTDIYSVSATFFELFAAKRLFDHDTKGAEAANQQKLRGERPNLLRSKTRDLPWEIETLLLGGLECEATDRPKSAAALAADLRRVLSNLLINYRRPPKWRRAQLFYLRNRALVQVTTALLTLMLLIASAGGYKLFVEWGQRKYEHGRAEYEAGEKEKEAAEKDRQKAIAQKEKELAIASEHRKVRIKYDKDMATARNLWDKGDMLALGKMLDEHDPSRPTDERDKEIRKDIAGFEWYFWSRIFNNEMKVIKTDDEGVICRLTVSSNGKLVAGMNRTGQVFFWDTESGRRLGRIPEKLTRAEVGLRDEYPFPSTFDWASFAVAFSPTESRLAVVNGLGGVSVFDVAIDPKSGQLISKLGQGGGGNNLGLEGVVFSPDGKFVAGVGGTLPVWQASTNQPIRELALLNLPRSGGFINRSAPIGPVFCAAFGPDGKRLASGGRDGVISFWDLQLGALDPTIRVEKGRILSLAFSRDGRRIASLNQKYTGEDADIPPPTPAGSCEVIIWDIKNNKELCNFAPQADPLFPSKTRADYPLIFSPDDKRVFCPGGRSIKVWSTDTGEKTREFRGHADEVLSIALTRDGKRAFSSSEDKSIRIWSVMNPEFDLLPEFAEISNLALFHPTLNFREDGKITVAYGWTNQLWDGSRWTKEESRLQPTLRSPDGSWYVDISKGKANDVFNARTRQRVCTIHGTVFAFSQDSRLLAARDGELIEICDLRTGEVILKFSEPAPKPGPADFGEATSLVFSPDGTMLASSLGEIVVLWDSNSGRLVRRTLLGHRGDVKSVVFSPDGGLLASAGVDAQVKIWDTTTGQLAGTLFGHRGPVCCLTFSEDGRRLVTGAAGVFGERGRVPAQIKLWDVNRGQTLVDTEEVFTLDVTGVTSVLAVSLSPDEKNMAAVCAIGATGGTVCICDTDYPNNNPHNSAHLPTAFPAPKPTPNRDTDTWRDVNKSRGQVLFSGTQAVTALAYSPDGRLTTACDAAGGLKSWDPSTGKEVLAFQGPTNDIYQLQFSQDGKRLFGSHNAPKKGMEAIPALRWQVWDAATGKLTLEREGSHSLYLPVFLPAKSDQVLVIGKNQGPPLQLPTPKRKPTFNDRAITPDPNSGISRNTELWDLATGNTIATFPSNDEYFEASLSCDGRYLVTAARPRGYTGYNPTYQGPNPEAQNWPTRLWDARTGKLLGTFAIPAKIELSKLRVSPDGQFLAAVTVVSQYLDLRNLQDNRSWIHHAVMVWNLKNGSQAWRCDLKTYIFDLAFNPESNQLAAACDDHSVKVWEAGSGKDLATLNAHTARVRAVAFSPDGRHLASASNDGTVRIWDTKSNR